LGRVSSRCNVRPEYGNARGTVETLAKHIQERLNNNKSCTVFERELERVWPSEKIKRLEREKKITPSPKPTE
jgi:hypothetical protein